MVPDPGLSAPVEPVPDFAARLLAWWSRHGRRYLPWQQQRSPYRVWVSEIMLQQTQVATVIPYFRRFMARFPSLEALAEAPLDAVLSEWSGLGYYARARNLHQAADRVMRDHAGRFPEDADSLAALPGIGRSTAHAIVAQTWNRRAAILDGNVKRVLARHAGIPGWPGQSAVNKQLWAEAERRTPPDQAADYTQAIMDLGALLCVRRSPRCADCPVTSDCVARAQGLVDQLPGRKPPRQRPERRVSLLAVRDDRHRILLRRRAPSGIWGGLWSLPGTDELPLSPSLKRLTALAPMRHDFTHFRLHIQFSHLRWPDTGLTAGHVAQTEDEGWFELADALALGLPQPIRRLLESIQSRELATMTPTPNKDPT